MESLNFLLGKSWVVNFHLNGEKLFELKSFLVVTGVYLDSLHTVLWCTCKDSSLRPQVSSPLESVKLAISGYFSTIIIIFINFTTVSIFRVRFRTEEHGSLIRRKLPVFESCPEESFDEGIQVREPLR